MRLLPANPDPTVATAPDEAAQLERVLADLQERGERPYSIPAGGSSAVGTLGYVSATLELLGQLWEQGETASHLYYAAGSRGTQAGLELGARIYNAPYRLCGVAVSGGEAEKIPRAVRIANEAAEQLGVGVRLEPADLHTVQGYIGEGYGVLTEGCREALRLLAQREGIFLDPVYSGKAMAGLIDHIRQGQLDPGETVIFLHSGGAPALFAQAEELMAG